MRPKRDRKLAGAKLAGGNRGKNWWKKTNSNLF